MTRVPLLNLLYWTIILQGVLKKMVISEYFYQVQLLYRWLLRKLFAEICLKSIVVFVCLKFHHINNLMFYYSLSNVLCYPIPDALNPCEGNFVQSGISLWSSIVFSTMIFLFWIGIKLGLQRWENTEPNPFLTESKFWIL